MYYSWSIPVHIIPPQAIYKVPSPPRLGRIFFPHVPQLGILPCIGSPRRQLNHYHHKDCTDPHRYLASNEYSSSSHCIPRIAPSLPLDSGRMASITHLRDGASGSETRCKAKYVLFSTHAHGLQSDTQIPPRPKGPISRHEDGGVSLPPSSSVAVPSLPHECELKRIKNQRGWGPSLESTLSEPENDPFASAPMFHRDSRVRGANPSITH
ncbi:hypothetical protein M413DRAFT_347545 [Hebeloma cylindrosporum]|uniref:Uncharacterized protein n=1 Tax=Hebeloma cylindrosporum TaxID=76867 RepID=A0A0C3BVW6_HEBCY|nr:hypothetical protein M413DRAFT_347545 [Hebeloma cylindrosporum h7]